MTVMEQLEKTHAAAQAAVALAEAELPRLATKAEQHKERVALAVEELRERELKAEGVHPDDAEAFDAAVLAVATAEQRLKTLRKQLAALEAEASAAEKCLPGLARAAQDAHQRALEHQVRTACAGLDVALAAALEPLTKQLLALAPIVAAANAAIPISPSGHPWAGYDQDRSPWTRCGANDAKPIFAGVIADQVLAHFARIRSRREEEASQAASEASLAAFLATHQPLVMHEAPTEAPASAEVH